MTIDEAIENEKRRAESCKGHYDRFVQMEAKEHEQIVEWLEELKAYKSGDFTRNLQTLVYKQGYNKAIEDFVSRLESVSFTKTQWDLIKTIAEQLKVGGENVD